MRQGEFVQNCRKENTTHAAIKILKGVNPLKSPIDPGEQFPQILDIRFAWGKVAKPFREIVTK